MTSRYITDYQTRVYLKFRPTDTLPVASEGAAYRPGAPSWPSAGEVIFRQIQKPGRTGLSDFTDMNDGAITLAVRIHPRLTA